MKHRAELQRGIYLIADTGVCPDDTLVPRVDAAVAAGVVAVQYRHKGVLTQQRVQQAIALADVCRAGGVPFFINDRVDLALLCHADGVHLGQDDVALEDARALLPTGAKIGISTHNADEVAEAEAAGADYVGFGNLFGTASKADAQAAQGCDALAAVCNTTALPVFGIGGIDLAHLDAVAAAGAHGAAVISAVLAAPDAAAGGRATMALVARWNAARKTRE